MSGSTPEASLKSASDRDLPKVDMEVNSSPRDLKQQPDDGTNIESPNKRPEGGETQGQWLEGIPLVMVITGLTLSTLLFMLDVSIVTTVREMF